MQIANFVPICKKHGRHRQFFFLVGQFLKSSLKPFGQIKQHFEMNSLNRESSIDSSYQFSVHLAKKLQRRFLEIDQPETRIAYGSHVFIGSEQN
jgi:hypothetical protein